MTFQMAQRQRGNKIGFKSIQLFKDQILGIGSYGKVCKAECDDLICAAKLLHETLFDPTAQHLIAPQSCLLYTSPSPRDATLSRMPSSA